MASRRTTTLTGAAAALVLGASALLVPPAAAHRPGPKPGPPARGHTVDAEHLARHVTTRGVWRHLEEFQRIADEHGSRAALTEGYEASARYVERTLRKAGYTTTRDPFTFQFEIVDAASLSLATGETYDVDQMRFSPSTPDGGLTALGAVPGDAVGCTEDSWSGVDAVGLVAVVSRGECAFAVKAANAEAAGAAGVVVYNNEDGPLHGTLGQEGVVSIPVVGLSQADGAELVEAVASGVELTLDARVHFEENESFNVIAETRAGRDDNVVVLGAHLDGVEDGPGLNDNGSGSAVLLEVAVQLAKQKKLNNTVRFAWWGAEELGLIGSTAYVTELAETDGELDRIATYLNFDMVGSPNYIVGVYDADESTYPAPVDVPEGSVETESVFTEYFDRIGQPWVDTEFSGRSDYQAFIANGVPASGLFTGADDVKTTEEVELFGGTAGIIHDPNYHTPADDLSNVSKEAIAITAPAIAFATASLANDTSAINGVSGPGGQGRPHPHPRPGKGHHGPGHGHPHAGLLRAS